MQGANFPIKLIRRGAYFSVNLFYSCSETVSQSQSLVTPAQIKGKMSLQLHLLSSLLLSMKARSKENQDFSKAQTLLKVGEANHS